MPTLYECTGFQNLHILHQTPQTKVNTYQGYRTQGNKVDFEDLQAWLDQPITIRSDDFQFRFNPPFDSR